MRPLVASAPAKVMLFGEWAVLDGGPCLLSSLNARFTARLEAAPGRGLTLDAGAEGTHAPGEPLPPFFELARSLLERLAPRAPASCELFQPGRRLSLTRDWPVSEGIGSSSALVACLLGLALSSKELALPALDELWPLGRELIRHIQGGRGSGADLAAQLWGGPVLLENARPRAITLEMPPELVLVHTGHKTSTTKALATTALDAGALREISEATSQFLRDRDWPAAIDRHFQALWQLGVVPENVAQLRSEGLASGLIGGLKTTGAGGGDALLLWSAPERRPELLAALAERDYYVSPHAWGKQGIELR
jgi:mevalonate kinase